MAVILWTWVTENEIFENLQYIWNVRATDIYEKFEASVIN